MCQYQTNLHKSRFQTEQNEQIAKNNQNIRKSTLSLSVCVQNVQKPTNPHKYYYKLVMSHIKTKNKTKTREMKQYENTKKHAI